jgi:hypothetical protein
VAFSDWLKRAVKNFNWKKLGIWAPLLVGLAMVLLGVSNLGMRNMIGLGFMTSVLSYGLISLFIGRIRLSDFID